MAPAKRKGAPTAAARKASSCTAPNPKRSKREEAPAAAAPPAKRGRPAKQQQGQAKNKKHDDALFKKNVELVKTTLLDPEHQLPSLPEHARSMLVVAAEEALKGEKAERHPFQNAFAKMLFEAFDDIRTLLEQKKGERRKGVQEANTLKDQVAAGVEAAKEAVEAKKKEIEEREAAQKAAEEAKDAATKTLKKAKGLKPQLEVQRTTLQKELSKTQAVYAETFAVLKNNPPTGKTEASKMLKKLTEQFQFLGLDESLRNSAPPALLKPLEARGDFDIMAIEAVDKLFVTNIRTTNERLAGWGDQLHAADNARNEAQQGLDNCISELQQAGKNVEQAEAERDELAGKLKACEKELKEHAKKVNKAKTDLEVAEEKLGKFGEAEDALAFMKDPEAAANKKEEEGEEEEEEEEAAMVEAEEEEVEELEDDDEEEEAEVAAAGAAATQFYAVAE